MRNERLITLLIALFAIVLVGLSGCAKESSKEPIEKDELITTPEPTKETKKPEWKKGSFVINGAFADAEVVEMNGIYRMYYCVEPEVIGNNKEIYSAVSTDGKTWKKEAGVRKTQAVFPDIVKLSNNKYRMYFSNAEGIKSATSKDGLTWTDDSGVRIEPGEKGFNIENNGGQGTTQLSDGSYIMVYRGAIPEKFDKYDKMIPNKNTSIFFYATSKDGLTWEKKGIALDSRNQELNGLLDGADWVKWSDGLTRLYYWSYKGIYYSTYRNGKFAEPVLDYKANDNPNMVFAPNPPGDPSIIKIKGTWYMYVGSHTKGIYYLSLSE